MSPTGFNQHNLTVIWSEWIQVFELFSDQHTVWSNNNLTLTSSSSSQHDWIVFDETIFTSFHLFDEITFWTNDNFSLTPTCSNPDDSIVVWSTGLYMMSCLLDYKTCWSHNSLTLMPAGWKTTWFNRFWSTTFSSLMCFWSNNMLIKLQLNLDSNRL